MPQPGMNGMEPAFGEAYVGHRCLLSPSYPLGVSPLGGRTEYDQSVVLMLGSPATPRKRPFELLSDLVDDGAGLGEEPRAERWDVSSLDEMTRYAKPGAEDAVLMARWGRSREEELLEEEEEEEERRKRSRRAGPPADGSGGGRGEGGGGAGAGARRVEVYQVAQEEEAAACSEEHNYSLCQADRRSGHAHDSDTQTEGEGGREEEEEEEEGGRRRLKEGETSPEEGSGTREEEEEDEEEDDEEEEDEEEEEEEEEAELSSSSETECEAEPERRAGGERPQKRRCFWEYRHARPPAGRRRAEGAVRWSLCWSSGTLPSTLYRREGKKGRRKARKTDASDLTPNPQKLHNIGEQLQKLNAAIKGMGPVNDLPVLARARSRKEKNKLASRACRLKKKAQHEANKIKLWGLNQEYDNLLGALLRIKEVIRMRVERNEEEEEEEEEEDERGMTRRLEDILKDSTGPLVAGRTKDFVQRILEASAGGQSAVRGPRPAGETPG